MFGLLAIACFLHRIQVAYHGFLVLAGDLLPFTKLFLLSTVPSLFIRVHGKGSDLLLAEGMWVQQPCLLWFCRKLTHGAGSISEHMLVVFYSCSCHLSHPHTEAFECAPRPAATSVTTVKGCHSFTSVLQEPLRAASGSGWGLGGFEGRSRRPGRRAVGWEDTRAQPSTSCSLPRVHLPRTERPSLVTWWLSPIRVPVWAEIKNSDEIQKLQWVHYYHWKAPLPNCSIFFLEKSQPHCCPTMWNLENETPLYCL